MLKQSQNPYGYRSLLVYKKAEELLALCGEVTKFFPKTKTMIALADQMNRSARSVKQNIVEGWKRNSSGEYYHFLGFAIGSNAELEEDCDDIIKGMYSELMTVRGLMGERGKTEMGDIEKISFYPMPKYLPPIIQLKLKAKEINFLLDRLQKSLASKMSSDGTLAVADKFKRIKSKEAELEFWRQKMLEDNGLVQLENGQIVKRVKGE